jgi:hypothetical protein
VYFLYSPPSPRNQEKAEKKGGGGDARLLSEFAAATRQAFFLYNHEFKGTGSRDRFQKVKTIVNKSRLKKERGMF